MAINKVNNKKYIGQTVNTLDKRRKQHEKGYASYMLIAKAIKKYGKEAFEWVILKECSTIEELNYFESYYIEKYDTTNPNYGYNLKGGGANAFLTDKVKERISKSQRGEKNHMYGKTGVNNVCSKKVINITENLIYDSATECAKAENNNISHICAVCRGERGSVAGNVYRYLDPDGNIISVDEKFKSRRLKIINLDTGEVFNNAAKAALSVNGNNANILNSIKNKTTAYGYHWDYYNFDNAVPSLID